MPFLEYVFSLFPSFQTLYCALKSNQQEAFSVSLATQSREQWAQYADLLKKSEKRTLDTAQWSPPAYISSYTLAHSQSLSQLKAAGEQLFQRGEVAMLTVAGGLGTRLNFPGPKGLLPVTPLKHKPLFQVFSEKIKALQQRYRRPIHWLIMTSEETDLATRRAFEEQKWHDAAYLHFFKQGTCPVFTQDGTCAIHEDGRVCFHPDGHGGVFRALQNAGLLQKLQDWQISVLSYFQVDNPLVYLGDTLVLGLHLQQASEFSTKIVQKLEPEERVGLFVQNQAQLELVEYCDVPQTLNVARDIHGRLLYRCGNTAIHLISVAFLQKHVQISLPCHVVQKKITTWDPTRKVYVEKLGYKLEKFIFDALPYAQHPLLWEIERSEEFSPVKNAVGNDSLVTCQRDQYSRWQRWLEKKHINKEKLLDTPLSFTKNIRVEISPLFSDSFEEFSDAWDCLSPKPAVHNGLYLE